MIEGGKDPPAQFFDWPEIPECYEFYWVAFGDLSTERQIGMSLGPIPRSSMASYANESGLYGDAAEHFMSVLRAVDDAYLGIANAAPEDKNKPHMADINDVEGTKRVLDSLRSRAQAKYGKS